MDTYPHMIFSPLYALHYVLIHFYFWKAPLLLTISGTKFGTISGTKFGNRVILQSNNV